MIFGVASKRLLTSDFAALEAAGAPVPARDELDGISFYHHLRGQRGPERPWVFYHYDPRPGWDKHKFTLHRFIQDRRYKLYDNGILIDVENDPLEQHIIYAEDDSRATAAARRKFQRVLKEKYDEWRNVRPVNNRQVH